MGYSQLDSPHQFMTSMTIIPTYLSREHTVSNRAFGAASGSSRAQKAKRKKLNAKK